MSFSKKFLCFFILLTTSLAQAGSIKFKVFESSVNEFQPFEVIIETGESSGTIKRVTIRDAVKNIIFFDLEAGDLVVKKSKNQILINDNVVNLFPLNKVTYDNYWGDAPIDPTHTYSVEVSLNLENKEIISGSIEIGDNDHQEMALWGDLKL